MASLSPALAPLGASVALPALVAMGALSPTGAEAACVTSGTGPIVIDCTGVTNTEIGPLTTTDALVINLDPAHVLDTPTRGIFVSPGALTINGADSVINSLADSAINSTVGGATAVTIGTITSGGGGIELVNTSGDDITVDVTAGGITAANQGIFVYGVYAGTDIDIDVAGGVRAGYEAIKAETPGGNVSITVSSGDVVSSSYTAIEALTFAGNIDISVAENINAVTYGVNAIAAGGAVDIAVDGDIESLGTGVRIGSSNSPDALETLSVSVSDIRAGVAGIVVSDYDPGVGNIEITASGDITSISDGQAPSTVGVLLDSRQRTGGTSTITIQGDISGFETGIRAINAQSGQDLVVISNGAIGAGATDITPVYGIVARSEGDITVRANDVTAERPVEVTSDADSTTSTTITGTIAKTGAAVADMGAITVTGLTNSVTLAAGSIVRAENGPGIVDATDTGARGDTSVLLQGTLLADAQLRDGSDRFEISGAAAVLGDGVVLDGGDDLSSADGFIDTLVLNSFDYSGPGAVFQNWENIEVTGGTVSFSDGAVTTGSDAGTGLTVSGGGTLRSAGNLALTGNLILAADGTLDATGGGSGDTSISGMLSTLGVITMGDGSAGDRVTVGGDFSGGGRLVIDTVLANDGSATDMLVINGSTSGTTEVIVNAAPGSVGAQTDRGILVVQVGGSSAGSFVLGQSVTAGAYTYRLERDGANWRLVSALTPIIEPPAPAEILATSHYEAIPSAVLAGFARLPTYKQRIGTRQGADQDTDAALRDGAWVRAWGDWVDLAPESSTSGSSADVTAWGLQAGYDWALEPGDRGQWVLGVTGQMGGATATLASRTTSGKLAARSVGLGATATWHGNNGLYFDAQAQLNRVTLDVKTLAGVDVARNVDVTATALSAELGYHHELSETERLIPQAQLTWSQMGSASFTDSAGNAVELERSKRVTGRLGLAYEWDLQPSGAIEGGSVYVIGNLIHDFDYDSEVTVNGAPLLQSGGNTWAEIGAGGTIDLGKGQTLYGEASYRKEISGIGGDGVSLDIGYRISF